MLSHLQGVRLLIISSNGVYARVLLSSPPRSPACILALTAYKLNWKICHIAVVRTGYCNRKNLERVECYVKYHQPCNNSITEEQYSKKACLVENVVSCGAMMVPKHVQF